MKKSDWILVEQADGHVVVRELELAAGFLSRLLGLQFRATLPKGRGLLLVPCGSIHTCFLRFSIDVAFLDAAGRVLAVRKQTRPWRAVLAPRGTHAVLEMLGGTTNLQADQCLAAVCQQTGLPIPKSLRFLEFARK